MFKALTNETLKGYICARRLANALETLHDQRSPILEIALASGIENQAAFKPALKQAFDFPPARYRALGKRTEVVRKLRTDEAYLQHLHNELELYPGRLKALELC